MFCSREKSIGLKEIQQNDKSTQIQQNDKSTQVYEYSGLGFGIQVAVGFGLAMCCFE